jgi:hypothetical protein
MTACLVMGVYVTGSGPDAEDNAVAAAHAPEDRPSLETTSLEPGVVEKLSADDETSTAVDPSPEERVAEEPPAEQEVRNQPAASSAPPQDMDIQATVSIAPLSETQSSPADRGDAASPDPGEPEVYASSELSQEPDLEKLTPEERRRLVLENRVRKAVQNRFQRQRRESPPLRGEPEDFFIVANYEMPLTTRVADLRFAVSEGIDPSVDSVVNYLVSTPAAHVRDYQVVARFASRQEAETGIALVRRRYDEARQYQEQLLAYLREQQVRASSIRRC